MYLDLIYQSDLQSSEDDLIGETDQSLGMLLCGVHILNKNEIKMSLLFQNLDYFPR